MHANISLNPEIKVLLPYPRVTRLQDLLNTDSGLKKTQQDTMRYSTKDSLKTAAELRIGYDF